jgi:Fe2+ transport system protein FeoA
MLEPEDADEAACMMEHGMNTRVCRALTSLLSAVHKDQGLAGTLRAAIEKENARLDCDNDKCDYSVPGKEIDTMKEEPMNLNMIEQGTSATILRIQGTGSLKKRLREMGITAGQQVLVVKSAPLDDPIEVKVRNYNLSLRREEAGSILVE